MNKGTAIRVSFVNIPNILFGKTLINTIGKYPKDNQVCRQKLQFQQVLVQLDNQQEGKLLVKKITQMQRTLDLQNQSFFLKNLIILLRISIVRSTPIKKIINLSIKIFGKPPVSFESSLIRKDL